MLSNEIKINEDDKSVYVKKKTQIKFMSLYIFI